MDNIDLSKLDRYDKHWLPLAIVIEDGGGLGDYTGVEPAMVTLLREKHGDHGVNAVWWVIKEWGEPPSEAVQTVMDKYVGFYEHAEDYARQQFEDRVRDGLESEWWHFLDEDFLDHYDWDGYGLSRIDNEKIEVLTDDDGIHVFRGDNA